MTIIADVGRDVTIREITRTYDEYGTSTETNSDSTITALIVSVSTTDNDFKSGSVKEHKVLGFFKGSDLSKIKDGNKIVDNGVTYDIRNVEVIYMSSSILHIEAELIALLT